LILRAYLLKFNVPLNQDFELWNGKHFDVGELEVLLVQKVLLFVVV
jgi:hypothetical protein